MSLEDVVNAMSKETNNATLGWDVVVNYTALEMNALLAAAYNEGGKDQLMEIDVSLDLDDPNAEDDDDSTVHVDYKFKIGPPLIEFKDSLNRPACRLYLPVIGGTVTRANKKPQTIDPGVYHLYLTGIALASVDGNKDSRKPKPSNEPFVFTSPNTAGVVTLDIDTSANNDSLKVHLKKNKEQIRLIDKHIGDLQDKIQVFFQTSSVHWDLARVNNTRPSNGATQLVPKFFRFATYSPSENSNYTILSLFIHVNDRSHGGTEDQLQSHWTSQWSKYKVPPIPHLYTASVIFNNALVKDEVEKSVKQEGMAIEEIPKTADDKSSIKWKILTHKKYEVDRAYHVADEWPRSTHSVDGVSLDLDSQAEGLYLSIGQNNQAVADALLKWHFGFTTNWRWYNGANGNSEYGTVTVTNRLDKVKYFDNDALPNYLVHLDASFSKGEWDWHRDFTNEEWHDVASKTNYDALSRNALPDPPSLHLEILDIDFFMTTNLEGD